MVGSRGGGRDGGVRECCLIVNQIGGDAVTVNRQGGTYVCVCVCAWGGKTDTSPDIFRTFKLTPIQNLFQRTTPLVK